MHLTVYGFAADGFDKEEQQMPAVQDGYGNKVAYSKAYRDNHRNQSQVSYRVGEFSTVFYNVAHLFPYPYGTRNGFPAVFPLKVRIRDSTVMSIIEMSQ